MVGTTVDSIRSLLAEARRTGVEDVAETVASLAPHMAAEALTIYVVDHQQTTLTEMGGTGAALAVDTTVAGWAYRTGAIAESRDNGAVDCWVPLVSAGDRLGVLRVRSVEGNDRARAESVRAAPMISDLIIDAARSGDTVERTRRRSRMLVPAELIRAELPALSYANEHLVISGILEPCYAVGGDAFDYAVNGTIAHLALFDAVGHGAAHNGLRAALLASAALASYRNARRAGLNLADTYLHVDRIIRDHDRSGLITGIFAELDQRTGLLRVISAGHPGGLIIRGGSVVSTLPTPTAMPVSLGDLQSPVIVTETLQPGDHLLLYTDGITEARTPEGEFFGVARLIDFVSQAMAAHVSAPETTRRLIHAILAHQNDVLQDDATVMLVHWIGYSQHRR